MAETATKVRFSRRNSGETDKYSGESESTAIMIFGFMDGNEIENLTKANSYDSIDGFDSGDFTEDDDVEDENSCNLEENKAFWESQEQQLLATLRRSSSMESKIRQATKDAMKEINLEGISCFCGRLVAADGCRNCMQREISNRLRSEGYNCTICKSKWRSSPGIPSGEHSYLEVVDDSRKSKKGETRVVIELNFRAEFEMARASEEYNRLIHHLPEPFVGKAERLKALIKILCSAAKKCMKEKKMHIPPWRKQKYMLAKWLNRYEEKTPPILPVSGSRPRKQRGSMLTFDLMGNFQSLHCSTAIKVV